MLNTSSVEDVYSVIQQRFSRCERVERVSLSHALNRTLAQDVTASEYVPSFHRSTVDGYAVRAADTFGCSDAMPALLIKCEDVCMGQAAKFTVGCNACAAVPTGGAVPNGADAVVMLEYAEEFGNDTIGIVKPVAPGCNMIFKGDDVSPGKPVLQKGRSLTPQDIGALAAMGIETVQVYQTPRVGIISTGDELVPISSIPQEGQIRDVNTAILEAMLTAMGVIPVRYGVLPDQEPILNRTVEAAVTECDMVLISGGSSVGKKDLTCRVLEHQGELLLHGISMKPGKPTLLASIHGKPVFGLPGNPVAACFVTRLFVKAAIEQLTGKVIQEKSVRAQLQEAVESNHGREQYCAVSLQKKDGKLYAIPIRSKSGLITSLAGTDGYFCISRDCEGVVSGSEIEVFLF